MTVRRTHGYSDTWDAFIDGILCPGFELAALGKLERLTQQLHWDQKIAMIVALSKDWTARKHRKSGEARKQQKAAAAAELARLTPLPGAFVDYVNDETKRLLPSSRSHPARPSDPADVDGPCERVLPPPRQKPQPED